jgi:hypothetical protein
MADSATDTTQASDSRTDEIQPYVDNAKETIKPILEEPEMDAFLREHIQKIPEWNEWSEAARQAYAHMMTSQMLQRKAMTTQITIGHPFKLPDYSAIKNLGLLLRRQPLPPPPKKKRKRPVVAETEMPPSDGSDLPAENVDMATQELASPEATAAETSTAAPISGESDNTATNGEEGSVENGTETPPAAEEKAEA